MPITNEAIAKAEELRLRVDRLNFLDESLKRWVREDERPTIVVRVMRYGVPIFEGCYGTSFTGRPLSMDTIFPVASITKSVISLLLHRLQEDGLVDLAAPVRLYLPDFTGGGREAVRIWQLLAHCGGIRENYSMIKYIKEELKLEYSSETITEEQWQELMRKAHKILGLPACKDEEVEHVVSNHIKKIMPLAYPPGTGMAYSNYGFEIAKDIVCKVTGESIDAYAKHELFDPLGMQDSHWILPEEKWNRVVGRNERCAGHKWYNTPKFFASESGSGGLKSTVLDLMKLLEMVRCGGAYEGTRVLSPASIRTLSMNHNTDIPGSYMAWGLGFNYAGMKKDDSGMLRSPNTIDHGGYAGCKVLIDFENSLSYSFFSVSYDNNPIYPTYRPYFTNMLMSALL